MKLLSVKDIYFYNLALFMHKIHHGKVDLYVNTFCRHNHIYETRHHDYFKLPKYRLSLAQRSILFQGPKLWNILPDYLRNKSSFNLFKK